MSSLLWLLWLKLCDEAPDDAGRACDVEASKRPQYD